MAFSNDVILKKVGRAALAVFSAVALSVTLAACGGSAVSEDPAPEPVEISDKTFPDDGFRGYVEDRFDQDSDGTLSVEEIECVETINVYGDGVSSFEGVQHFVNLTTFCYTENVYVTNIDLSRNTKLTDVEVKGECDSTVILPIEMDEANADCSKNVTVVVDEEEPEGVPEGDGEEPDGDEGDDPFAGTDSVSSNASSWVQQYNGVWYSDGVYNNLDGLRPVNMEGTEPLGASSPFFIIQDDFVYYLLGSTYDLGAGSIYCQTLDGLDGYMVTDQVAANDFYIYDGYIYFTAATGEYNEETCIARVSLSGDGFEYLYGLTGWLAGVSASDGILFTTDYESGALLAYDADTLERVDFLPDFYNVYEVGEIGPDSYYAVVLSSDGYGWKVVFFDSEGFLRDEVFIETDLNYVWWANPVWFDGTTLYAAGEGGITAIDVDSCATDWIDVNEPANCLGDVTPVFVDDSVVYYGVNYEYGEYSDVTTALHCHDRETGDSWEVDAWYIQ